MLCKDKKNCMLADFLELSRIFSKCILIIIVHIKITFINFCCYKYLFFTFLKNYVVSEIICKAGFF